VQYAKNAFLISTDNVSVHARVCCGSFGKRSNLDVKWRRPFIREKSNALNNFIGVKYHAKTDHPRNMISLHNFKGGYCGIAPIEDNNTCICYLTTALNLRQHGNNLQALEEEVLYKNPLLKRAFAGAAMLYEKPLTISQISFDKKEQVYDHILLLGDAAGLITPLCGNGMSMALHSSRMAAKYIIQYLQGKIDRSAMENGYVNEWRSTFSARLRAGRIIQGIFSRQWFTNGVISVLRPFPALARSIIRQTHG
jgi:flavin-dependent dehydrogenase